VEQRLSVSCVRQGTRFSDKYVQALLHLDPVTLTDVDTPGRTRALRNNYAGWTAKMELFAPWNEDLRPCFYLDLDTIVLDNIDDILHTEVNELWLIRDLYNSEKSNSGLMLIPKDTTEIWDVFQNHTMRPGRKFLDGHFLSAFPHKIIQDEFDGIVSYKADNLEDGPKGRICCFHGYPKQEDLNNWAGFND